MKSFVLCVLFSIPFITASTVYALDDTIEAKEKLIVDLFLEMQKVVKIAEEELQQLKEELEQLKNFFCNLEKKVDCIVLNEFRVVY